MVIKMMIGDEKCAYEGCENDVDEQDYCPECVSYVCEDHNGNLMNLSTVHAVEDHWSEE